MKTCDTLLTLIKNLDDPSKYKIYMNTATYDKYMNHEIFLYSVFYRLKFFTYNQLDDGIVIVALKGTDDEKQYQIVGEGNG